MEIFLLHSKHTRTERPGGGKPKRSRTAVSVWRSIMSGRAGLGRNHRADSGALHAAKRTMSMGSNSGLASKALNEARSIWRESMRCSEGKAHSPP